MKNHPDSKITYSGFRWKDLEPQNGVCNFTQVDERLQIAADMGWHSILRVAPYALEEKDDIPCWLREMYPENPEFIFWKIDPCTTEYSYYWARFITEFAKRYNGHPNIAGVDMAIVGAWGEGGGTEYMPDDKILPIVKAYTQGFSKTHLHALLHDERSVELIRKQNSPVGYRVDCLGDMGGFHGEEWSHMLDFYPQNIQNFNMGEAWEQAPIVFEACWHMNDWYLQGWDIDYIIDESLKWHISSYNSKQTTVPKAWKSKVERWVKKMGYRYEIHKIVYESSIKHTDTIKVELLLTNTGVAPCYWRYNPVLKLENSESCYILQCSADNTKWLPDEDRIVILETAVPSEISAANYNLFFAFPTQNNDTFQLAIKGRDENGFYSIGELSIS